MLTGTLAPGRFNHDILMERWSPDKEQPIALQIGVLVLCCLKVRSPGLVVVSLRYLRSAEMPQIGALRDRRAVDIFAKVSYPAEWFSYVSFHISKLSYKIFIKLPMSTEIHCVVR